MVKKFFDRIIDIKKKFILKQYPKIFKRLYLF